MGEPHVAHVGGQFLRQLAIAEPAVAFLRATAPRAEMDLVDRYRRAQGVGADRRRLRARQRLHVDHDRGGLRPQLGREGDRIRFERQHRAVRPDDLVFVFVARARRRHEDFPEAVAAHPHGMAAAIPEIEVADHADAPGVGGKHHEGDPGDSFEHQRMGAELVVEMQMRAFAEQIEIEIGQHRRKAVRVLDLDHLLAVTGAQVVARRAVGQRTGEQPGLVDARAGCWTRPRSSITATSAASGRKTRTTWPSSPACRPR